MAQNVMHEKKLFSLEVPPLRLKEEFTQKWKFTHYLPSM